MLGTMRHRGPDGEGIWTDDAVPLCLGHRRLAIIDLSESGAQPMTSMDGSLVLSINGEIYNYVELRAELEAEGVPFRGTSDTEVLLAGMARWGFEAALQRARGMFALALWDRRQRILYLARDRVGKKPLYYRQGGRGFVFASEIKALAAVAGAAMRPSSAALWHYLSLGYIPSPMTIYEGVSELPPGHLARVSPGGSISLTRYWAPGSRRTEQTSVDEAVERLDVLLRRAIAIRRRADVPVGVFLSGGIDSGLIAALCADGGGSVHTFTASVPDPRMDESGLAALVAERYGTHHEVLPIDPDVRELLPVLAAAYDEPFGDPSAVPTYAIAEAAARRVKVVLNGEGGDELFGGYRRHLAMAHLDRLPPTVVRSASPALRRMEAILPPPSSFRSRYALIRRFLRGLAERTSGERYLSWSSDGFSEDDKCRLFGLTSPPTDSTPSLVADRSPADSGSALTQTLAIDFGMAMPDGLLVKLDIATMAHSLEARCPFLDQELAEWAFSLETSSLMPGGGTKPLLRALAGRLLPPQVVQAPKRGFEIPIRSWLRGPLRDLVGDVVTGSNGTLSQLMDDSARRQFVDAPAVDEDRWARQTWLLLMLGLWEDHANRLRRS